jgi:hypothetical protein
MNIARRLALTVVIAALLCAAAFGTGWALRPSDEPLREDRPAAAASTVEPEQKPRTGAPRAPKETHKRAMTKTLTRLLPQLC